MRRRVLPVLSLVLSVTVGWAGSTSALTNEEKCEIAKM